MPNWWPDVITNSTWWPPYLCASGTDPGSTLPPLAYCTNSSVWAALTATFRIPSTTSCWVCYIPDGPSIIKCTNSVHRHDSTFESAASLSGPLSGVGVDLENMQFFTVRTKFPLTSSTGSFSAEKKWTIKTHEMFLFHMLLLESIYLWDSCRTHSIEWCPVWGLTRSVRHSWTWLERVQPFWLDSGSHPQLLCRSPGRVLVQRGPQAPEHRLTVSGYGAFPLQTNLLINKSE